MVLGLREVLGTATSRQSRRLRAIEALPRRRSSQSQLSPAAFSVLERHFRRGERPLLPVKDGKALSIEEARRWWSGMLKGR
jgi:hypothetical protein